MSLKAFHLIFVSALTALFIGLAAFCFHLYQDSGSKVDLLLSGLSVLAAIVVLVYGKYFLKKFKKLSYL